MAEIRMDCFICSWRGFLRAHYFQKRIEDLLPRAIRIIGSLPKSLEDKKFLQYLESIKKKNGKDIRLCVLGTKRLSSEDFHLSQQSYIKEDSGAVDEDCWNMLVCYTELKTFDLEDLKVVQDLVRRVHSAAHRPGNVLIFCLTNKVFSQEECGSFREKIMDFCRTCQLSVPYDAVVTHTKHELAQGISKSLETQLIDIFLEIRIFLQMFIGRYSSHSRIINILQSKIVSKGILGFLRNGYCLADTVTSKTDRKSFLKALTEKLANEVMCILIAPVSAKYVLPKWVCTRLLHEMNFENKVVKSFSKYTYQGLNKLCFFGQSCKNVLENGKQSTYSYRNDAKCLAFDFMLRPIKADLQNTIELMENSVASMEKLSTVMKKMTFEIDGYLKQTNVCLPITSTDFEVKIPTDLRRDIMSLDGVFGLGTIYGDVEIHLHLKVEPTNNEKTELTRKDTDDKIAELTRKDMDAKIAELIRKDMDDKIADLTRKVQCVMKTHHFAYPYTIKTVKP